MNIILVRVTVHGPLACIAPTVAQQNRSRIEEWLTKVLSRHFVRTTNKHGAAATAGFGVEAVVRLSNLRRAVKLSDSERISMAPGHQRPYILQGTAHT